MRSLRESGFQKDQEHEQNLASGSNSLWTLHAIVASIGVELGVIISRHADHALRTTRTFRTMSNVRRLRRGEALYATVEHTKTEHVHVMERWSPERSCVRRVCWLLAILGNNLVRDCSFGVNNLVPRWNITAETAWMNVVCVSAING